MILIHPFWQSCPTNLTGASAVVGINVSNVAFIPHYGLYDYGWSAWILTPAEIGGAKQISAIGVYSISYNTGYTYPNQVIKMGHVSQSAWPSATPQIDLSDLTVTNLKTVKSSFSDTVVNNVYSKHIFDSNFCYNGTSNLLIVWENRCGAWASGYGTHNHMTGVNQGAYAFQDTTYPTGTGTRISTKPVTKIYS